VTRIVLPLRLRKILVVLFVTLVVVYFYTLLHEGGHALVGLLAGQTLLGLDLNFITLSAHVEMSGQLAGALRTLQIVAGTGLPLLVWAGFMLAVPRRADAVLELLKTVSTLSVLSSLLPWMAFPLALAAGLRPPIDDVLSFIASSQWSPLVVAGLAAIAYVAGWGLFLRRIEGVRSEVALLVRDEERFARPGEGRTLWSLMAVLALSGAMGLALTAAFPAGRSFEPPPGYRLAATVDLAQEAASGRVVVAFTLSQPAEAGIYVLVKGIDTDYVDLVLEGPGGWRQVILHGEGYQTASDGARFQQRLEAGEYRVILSNKRSPGLITVYLKTE